MNNLCAMEPLVERSCDVSLSRIPPRKQRLTWLASCLCMVFGAQAQAATKTITIKTKPGDAHTYTSVKIYKNAGDMTITAPGCTINGPKAGSTGTWQLTNCTLNAANPLTITFTNNAGSINFRLGGYDYTGPNGQPVWVGVCSDPIAARVVTGGPTGTNYVGYAIPPNEYGYFYQMFPNQTNPTTVLQAQIYLGLNNAVHDLQVLNRTFPTTPAIGTFDLNDLEVPLKDPPDGYVYEVVQYMEPPDATGGPGIHPMWSYNPITGVATMDFTAAGGLPNGLTGSIVAYSSQFPPTMILDNVNVDYQGGADPPCTGTYVNETPVPASPGCVCNGDVTNNGITDAQDLSAVISCTHGNCGGCVNSCDVNCDGIVNNDDANSDACRFQGLPPEICCPPVLGACCLPLSGFCPGCCEPRSQQDCQQNGGAYQGDNSSCNSNPCGGTPPPDNWTTWTDGQLDRSYLDLTLPVEFFGPGSEPFDGRIQWAGQPLNSSTTGDADTVVQRPFDPIRISDPIGTFGTVPIELVQLSLVSAEPITVNCNGVPTHWNVAATLSPTTPAPQGTMTAQKTHQNGGTFDSVLFVHPLLTFTRTSPPEGALLVTGESDGNRYVYFMRDVSPQNKVDDFIALRVRLDSLQHPDPPNLPQFPPLDYSVFEGQFRWVGPINDCQESETPHTTFKCAQLQCGPYYQDVNGTLQGAPLRITGSEIIPSSHYSIQAIVLGADAAVEASYTPALVLNTQRWGDVASPFQQPFPAPLTQPNIADVAAIVDKFKSVSGAIIVARADLNPALPNASVNIADVASDVDAFKNLRYPFPISQICPPSPPSCDGPGTVTLDTGAAGMPPFQLHSNGSPWVHNANPNLGVILPPNAQFVPGIQETNPGDPTSQQVRVLVETSPDLQHSVCLPVPEKGSPPGLDYFQTVPCNGQQSISTEFVSTPIPAGFFGPGSLPFNGGILLVGSPIGPGDTDTIIRRNGSLSFGSVPSTDSVPIEIVALSLQSAAPITVSYNNGNPNEAWNVAVGLSTASPPAGQLTATKTHRNGGTLEARFFVQPRFTFTRISDSVVRILDTGEQGLPPLQLGNSDPNLPPDQCFKPMPWVQSLALGSPVIAGSESFIPGVKEDPTTQMQCCEPNCDEALQAGAFGSSHCTAPVNCGPQFCP
ncbi:MAG: hypothetical protein HY287_15340 [Planctomycetes bacterium]|nr:hypothetical protein [Planctomycetota bacterium]MBI3835698.1 hypothetical protein [Planctomycetota bacterium]